MKLRLNIATPGGPERSFEHAGPVVRIGRDPAAELSLQGDDGRSVSWNHARIELSAAGAVLADTGSSNGTLVNDRRIERATALHEGDRVQFGYTGATLSVAEIDLTPVAAVAEPARRVTLSPAVLWSGAAAVASVLLAMAVWLLLSGPRKPVEEQAQVVPPPPAPVPAPPPTPPRTPQPEPEPAEPRPNDPAPTPPARQTEKDPLAAEAREVGRYVALPQWGPGVLLQRQGEAYPWTPLRPESKVSTATTLVCLPGYRCTLALDSGLRLTLWGNLPEFSAFPPVLESVVMLNNGPAGVDLDLTLERGRVHLVNAKPSGAGHVQLRFLRQTWQLTLPERGQEACVEIWPVLGSAGPVDREQPAPLALGLFVKGKARLEVPGTSFDLADRSRVSWSSAVGATPDVEVLPALPEWWSKALDRSVPQVADAMLTVLDWSTYLNRSSETVDTILTRIRESTDPTLRVVGLLFLAALDGTPFLVDFLEDRQHAEVRGAARHALQVWLSRRPDNRDELVRLLKEKRGYAPDKGRLIVQLFLPIPREALGRAETYQNLIGHLEHENLIVRDLAFWHLAHLVPEAAGKIAYDPLAEGDKRRKAIEEWRRLLPAGKLPRLPSR